MKQQLLNFTKKEIRFTLNIMSNLLKDVSYGLGVKAFKDGKKRIPAMDKLLLENCLTGCKIGESIPYLKAWLKGWDYENLKEEII